MLKGVKSTVVIAAISLIFGGAVSANAASFISSNKDEQKEKTEKVYEYAKGDLLKNNKNVAIDSKTGKTTTAKLFDKKAYTGVGATAGYQDLLLGLKKQGYQFTENDKKIVTDNLVVTKKSKPTQLANAIIAIQAIGLNPESYKGTEKKINLVKTLYKSGDVLSKKSTVNEQSQVLVALKSNKDFKAPKDAKFSIKKLSQKIAKEQIEVNNKKDKNYANNGGWAYNGKAADVDVDTSAMALTALNMSKNNNKSVKNAITNAQNYIKNNTNKDGGYGMGGNSNANSNAEVIIALSTSKKTFKNINKEALTENQKNSVLQNTLSFIKDKDGSIKDAFDQTMGAGQVLLSISAYDNGEYSSQTVYQFK